jgi:hypothetical protein
MSKIDKTKKSIGINKIEEKDRQEIFKKFLDAGGQVIKEDSSNKDDQKPKQTSVSKPTKAPIARDRKKSTIQRSPQKTTNDSNPIQIDPNPRVYENQYSSFWSRFFLKMKAWSSKVTHFGDPILKPEFLSELNLELKESLLIFNMASRDILGNPEVYPQVVTELSKESTFYPELIIRGGKLLDYAELESLFEEYKINPNIKIPVSKVYPSLYSLFRKLFFLYPYQNTYKKALEKGYDLLEKYEKKPSAIYKAKKKQLKQNHFFIFEKAFDKIYLAVLRHQNINIPLTSDYMNLFLEIKNDERIGSMKTFVFSEPEVQQPIENNKEDANSEDSNDEKEEVAEEESPILTLGKELLLSTPLDVLRKKHDQKKDYAEINIADKSFLTYLFFKEFDSEYSLVMTTKKININTTNVNGLKIDHRENLMSTYEMTRNCSEQFRIYIESLREYDKIKSTPLSNYIEQSKKMTQADQKKNIQSRSFRSSVKEYFSNVTSSLKIFIDDMESEKVIIGNSEDILNFDNVESKKKLNKKKIKDAITESYAFSLALLDKLSGDGDLYGASLEETNEEMKANYGIEILTTGTEVPIETDETSKLSDLK